jgi:hypothetical protein
MLPNKGTTAAAGPPAGVLAPGHLEPIYDVKVCRDGIAPGPFTPRIPQTKRGGVEQLA